MYTCHVPPFRFNVSFTDSNVNIYQLKADSKFLLFLLFLRHIFFVLSLKAGGYLLIRRNFTVS